MFEAEKTIEYYNLNANRFIADTVSVEFKITQERLANKLPDGACILDFGCGSGRDVKYFLSKGYQVDALDGSPKLCKLASAYAGIEVKNMFFQDLEEIERYDGIWACASILHLPFYELADVFSKMVDALKKNGIIYTSFKYGVFEGERNGRFFTDMTEDSFADFIKQIKSLTTEEQWVTFDVRPGRGEERWLNLILRKQ